MKIRRYTKTWPRKARWARATAANKEEKQWLKDRGFKYDRSERAYMRLIWKEES